MAEIFPEDQALSRALATLRAGEVVALPTETVYGLAADAANGEAVVRIFETKRRPRFNPLIAHVASLDMAQSLASFDPVSLRLAEAFWPGPLTLVLPLREPAGVHPLVTAGLPTVALRVPRGFARDLIAAFGGPLAAPSANSSGRISPTSAAAVMADLGSRIPLIVDGGRTLVGVESTIVKVNDGEAVLLRPGGIAAPDIERVLGRPLHRGTHGAIAAPGMMASHYAPRAAVRLHASDVVPGEALLAFGPRRIPGAEGAARMENLSPAGDLGEAARNLFAMMNALDLPGVPAIAVEPIPAEGLGEAINDRLARAAAPRDAGLAQGA
ncbi:MAG: threonylcarbamoyl-AMP synthase [Rhizobiales bacterium]|nr:threonylcarbamoyl-AMP synthase [Hyphomicrobiales bacterium]